MSARLTAPAFLLAGALLACAEHRAPAAADVGLLVGLSSGRTFWIAARGGAAQLVARKSHLLVPRTDGFWWVGTVQRCTIEEFDGGGMNIDVAGAFVSRAAALFVTRAGEPARVALDGVPCGEAEREVMRRRAARAARANDSSANDSSGTVEAAVEATDELDCSVSTRQVTFVTATALSVESRYRTTESCSPAKYYTDGADAVTRFASDERIALRPLLAPAQRDFLARALSDTAGCGFDEEMTADNADTAWAVRRADGAWVADVWVNGPIACRGGADVGLALALPPSFTGDSPLPVAWAELKRRIPDLRDAAASPSGAHLVLLVRDTLSLVRLRNGTIGEPLFQVPVGWDEQVVMLRWASAAELARWNREIPALAEPEVRVQAPASPR